LEEVEKKGKRNCLEILEQAIKNATPQLEVRSTRIGGATYQIPIEVKGDRGMRLALRWMVEGAREKKGKRMWEKLAEEILLASKGQGFAVKKKEEIHKIAEANKAFARFAW
jgi:small subunit ribosomal protein S7